jgi:hypothetical protein
MVQGRAWEGGKVKLGMQPRHGFSPDGLTWSPSGYQPPSLVPMIHSEGLFNEEAWV